MGDDDVDAGVGIRVRAPWGHAGFEKQHRRAADVPACTPSGARLDAVRRPRPVGTPGTVARHHPHRCPQCSTPAEITGRFVLESTDGPVEHVRVRCLARHWSAMPTAQLAPGWPVQPTGQRRRVRWT